MAEQQINFETFDVPLDTKKPHREARMWGQTLIVQAIMENVREHIPEKHDKDTEKEE